MARQAHFQGWKSVAGAALLAIGLVLLLANLDAVIASLTDSIGHPAPQAADTVLAFGLAGLHAVQAYAFEHPRFVSGVRQILVSFWPLILVLLGALLLHGGLRSRFSGYLTNMGASADGER